MKNKSFFLKRDIIILLVCFISLFVQTFNINVWTDELFTMNMCKNSFSEIWYMTASDTHPPLFYWMAKVFTSIFGESATVFKIFSALGYFATMLLYVPLKKIKISQNNELSFLYLIIIALMPCMLRRGIDIRMYSWTCFFVTAAVIEMLKIYQDNKIINWILCAIFTACAMYSHYYGTLAVFILWVLLGIFLIREKKTFLLYGICGLCLVAVYFPWMTCLFGQVERVSTTKSLTIDQISIMDFGEYIAYFYHTGKTLISVVLSVSICLFLGMFFFKSIYKKQINKGLISLACILLLTPGIGILVSFLVTPVFIAKYLSVVAGIFAILLATAMSNLKKKTKIWFIVILLFGSILTYIDISQDQNDNALMEIRAYIRRYEDVPIIAEDGYAKNTLEYLMPNADIYLEENGFDIEKHKTIITVRERTDNSLEGKYLLIDQKDIYSRYQSKNYSINVYERLDE